MAITTQGASALVQGKGQSMAEEMVEFVVASDCACDGEAFARGETRTVRKSVYRELVAAGRVCRDDAAIEGAVGELRQRQGASAPADKPEPEPKPSKSKGNA